MTLFPEMIEGIVSHSILGRAVREGIIEVNAINIRDFSKDKHKHVDDYPYGGGAGMVMKAEPIYDCYKSIDEDARKNARVIYLSPQGRVFDQQYAKELSKEENIVFLCGHYEGVDERILEELQAEELSIGDFVLTGGELAVSVVIDSVSRLISGVLGKDESFENESFSDGLLEYPQYTRPEEFMGRRVPDVLLSGHHANIEKWRREQSIIRTYEKRPDLMDSVQLDKEEKKFLEEYKNSKDIN